jgi:hypothetical protein
MLFTIPYNTKFGISRFVMLDSIIPSSHTYLDSNAGTRGWHWLWIQSRWLSYISPTLSCLQVDRLLECLDLIVAFNRLWLVGLDCGLTFCTAYISAFAEFLRAFARGECICMVLLGPYWVSNYIYVFRNACMSKATWPGHQWAEGC